MTYRWTDEDLALARRRRKPSSMLAMSEKDLQAAIIELAELQGWHYYHTQDSRSSVIGYPDLTLVKPPKLIFVELKSEKGIVSLAQELWLQRLSEVPGVEALIWRPADWMSGEVERVLTSKG